MTDTSELVRRLRFWMPTGSKHLEEDLAEAADRIEALEAQNKRLREALEPFAALADEIEAAAKKCEPPYDNPESWAKSCAWDDLVAASAALKETER